MPAVEEQPALTHENKASKEAMGRWMGMLNTELPNPSLGRGATEKPNEPLTTTVPPDPEPEQPPAGVTTAEPETKPDPAAPPPEKPTETTTSAPAEERWPRSAKEWKNFTSARKAKDAEYEKTITERDAKIKELESKAGTPAAIPEATQKELETLRKENEQFSKQLRLVAVTSHPRFKQYFETKTASTLAQLKSCVPADQVDTVATLIQSPDGEAKDEAIDRVMENMSTLQKGRFMAVVNGLSAIQAEREGEVTRAAQDYEQMMGQAKSQREAQQAAFTKSLDDTVKAMQDPKAGRPEYQLREGETEWNASVVKRIEVGRGLITGNLKPEIMFKAAFDAAAYSDVLTGYRAALGEVEKLKAQIAKMSAANPKVESQTRTERPGIPGTTPALPKDARPMDHTKGWIQRFGEAMRGESA